jgi:hypothetical protein
VKECVLKIRSHLVDQKFSLPLRPDELFANGIIRYYVCDTNGNQVSPNYEIRDNAINIYQHKFNMNWGHRPYFALFQALRNTAFHNLYSSSIYRDVGSQALCQTYGNFLDDNNILLVDVKVLDPTLYVDGSFEPI